jgi:hypothetical protein
LAGWGWQESVVSLHTPVLHWSLAAEQSVGEPLPQAPRVQVSPVVQNWPSLQAVPSATSVEKHPVTGSQESAVQVLESSHVIGTPMQEPERQVSSRVHTLASLQAAPSRGTESLTQVSKVSSQESAVHWLPSLQVLGELPPQTPAEQVSPTVQNCPSLQAVPLRGVGLLMQPRNTSQESAVQALPSSQLEALPPPQVPAEQVSPTVQASPSLQAVPLRGAESLMQASVVSLQESAVH